MQAVQDGDVSGLAELFERYHRPIYRFLARTTGDRAAAEDLVQDVFVRVLKYRGSFDRDACFETWLYRIARNARTDHFRRQRPEAPVDEALTVLDADPGPAERLQQAVDREQLARALRAMDEEPRDLLVLARFQGMPYDRIAELLGIEVGAVKVRVHRALRQLRDCYFRLEDTRCAVKK